jgi:hypothetical protein
LDGKAKIESATCSKHLHRDEQESRSARGVGIAHQYLFIILLARNQTTQMD